MSPQHKLMPTVQIEPATAQTLMDWNVLHHTDAGWLIDLDIWRTSKARPTTDVSTDGLVERLRDADRGSVQRSLGSRIFGEAADRIEALQRSNAEKDEALRRISAPLGNPPEKQDGDKAETIIRFWRGVAVRCREIARKALEDREIG
jgi:hypothetical protein